MQIPDGKNIAWKKDKKIARRKKKNPCQKINI